MGNGQNSDKIPWIFILLLGFALVLILFAPDLSARLTGRAAGNWDPFSPILDGLAGIGQSIQDQFRNILR